MASRQATRWSSPGPVMVPTALFLNWSRSPNPIAANLETAAEAAATAVALGFRTKGCLLMLPIDRADQTSPISLTASDSDETMKAQQYGRRIEIDGSWTVYHVFTGIPVQRAGIPMAGLSRADATSRMLLNNQRQKRPVGIIVKSAQISMWRKSRSLSIAAWKNWKAKSAGH